MAEILTAAEMRALEGEAIDRGETTGLALMETAGQAVVASAFSRWPGLSTGARRATILCGPGNNGGDGFVIARLLQGQGWQVEVSLFGQPDQLPPDARKNHDRWLEIGPCHPWSHTPQQPSSLIIDALFGTGLTRPLPPEIRNHPAFDNAAHPLARRLAVDIPSGLCSDSGRDLGARPADLTVTFHRAKLGHYLARGPAFCGQLVIADIGL